MASRCTWTGFPPRTSRVAYALRRCDVGVRGHTRSGRKQKGPAPCGIRASGIQSAAGCVVRRSSLPDRGDPRTRDGRAAVRRAARSSTAAGRARTRSRRQGPGRCEGRSGCSRWCPGFGSVSTSAGRARASGGASCKKSSLFQATGSSVNSLYCLRKGRRPGLLRAIHVPRDGAPAPQFGARHSGEAQANSMSSKKNFLLARRRAHFQNRPHCPTAVAQAPGRTQSSRLTTRNSPWHLTSPSGR